MVASGAVKSLLKAVGVLLFPRLSVPFRSSIAREGSSVSFSALGMRGLPSFGMGTAKVEYCSEELVLDGALKEA